MSFIEKQAIVNKLNKIENGNDLLKAIDIIANVYSNNTALMNKQQWSISITNALAVDYYYC